MPNGSVSADPRRRGVPALVTLYLAIVLGGAPTVSIALGQDSGQGAGFDPQGADGLVKPIGKPKVKLTISEPQFASGGQISDDYKASVKKRLRSRMAVFRSCAENAYVASPYMGAGKVTLEFGIGKQGNVSFASMASSTLSSDVLGSCLVAKLKTLQFDAPASPDTVVTFGLVFGPPELMAIVQMAPEDEIVKLSGKGKITQQPFGLGSIGKGLSGLDLSVCSSSGSQGLGGGDSGGFSSNQCGNVPPPPVLTDEKAILSAEVEARLQDIDACARESVGLAEGLAGRMRVKITIGKNGKVGKVLVAQDETGSKPLGKCVAKHLREMAFGPSKSGAVTWQVPLRFNTDPLGPWPLPDPIPLVVNLASDPEGIGKEAALALLEPARPGIEECFAMWLRKDPDASVSFDMALSFEPGAKTSAKMLGNVPVHSATLGCLDKVLGALALPPGAQGGAGGSASGAKAGMVVKLDLTRAPLKKKAKAAKAKPPGKGDGAS